MCRNLYFRSPKSKNSAKKIQVEHGKLLSVMVCDIVGITINCSCIQLLFSLMYACCCSYYHTFSVAMVMVPLYVYFVVFV